MKRLKRPCVHGMYCGHPFGGEWNAEGEHGRCPGGEFLAEDALVVIAKALHAIDVKEAKRPVDFPAWQLVATDDESPWHRRARVALAVLEGGEPVPLCDRCAGLGVLGLSESVCFDCDGTGKQPEEHAEEAEREAMS